MRELKGWYSGKYDSTKQRQVIQNETDRFKYITSIRFEMLLANQVVITDAQWYDGLFFASMATEYKDEFDAFIKFVKKGLEQGSAPFIIRRRSDYIEMFRKPFLFSSVENSELQKFIFKIWNNNDDKKEHCNTLNKFLDFIEQELMKSKSAYLLTDFLVFKQGMLTLDSIDKRIFVQWGEKSFIPEKMKEATPQLKSMISEFQRHPDLVNKITLSLEKEYPNRSEIKTDIKKLAELVGCENLSIEFMHLFDEYYNMAIALQHDCKYYDLYDAVYNTKFDKITQTSIYNDTQKFPQEVIRYLGAISWNEFSDIFYNKAITKKRTKWLNAFDSGIIDDAQKHFMDYIDCIMKNIKGLNTWLINNSVFYRKTGTKRFINITIDDVSKMVGGSGSDNKIDSEQICLFFGGNLNNIKGTEIVRYASTEQATELLGTVFAPIENEIIKLENNKCTT